MDKNRKIVLSILILMVLTAVLAIIDISLSIQGAKRDVYPFSAPGMGPGVGIVRIYGPITIDSQCGGMIETGSSSDAVVERLTQLEEDKRIRAIILRINSPGGTVAATQEIYDKLMKLRKKNIIIVASMGELAASGGYYVASACNHIMANRGTITGSIGVIAVTPNLKGLFEKLGIRMNVIKSGKYKDILSSYREISPEERELIQQMIDSSYQQFIKDVAAGRNLAVDDITPQADGRVFGGDTALRHKLIDGLGSFEDALKKARELAKLPDDSPVYDEIRSPLEKFLMSMSTIFNPGARIEQRILQNHVPVEYRYQP